MSKLTEKERRERQAQSTTSRKSQSPQKARRRPTVVPVFSLETEARGPEKRIRIRCPCCNMMPAIEAFRSATPQLAIYEQSFGGRVAAPEGVKPGKKSKKAPGVMNYVDITDPESDIYQEVSGLVKERIRGIKEIL